MFEDDEVTFAGNSAINAAIKEMLPFFDTASQQRIQRAILNAKKAAEKHGDENTDAAARHIFRELIPASVLNQSGFSFEYEKAIGLKTPDWIDESTNMLMEAYTYERGGSSNFFDRVTAAIANKCHKYEEIVAERSLFFVVSVYLDFLTGISVDDCAEDCERFRPTFENNRSLKAIIFFTETRVVNRKQEYGYLCVETDSMVSSIPNWPFFTMNVNR
jgi:hypothetical protein